MHGVVLVIGGLCAPIVFPIVTVFITWRKLYLNVMSNTYIVLAFKM